MSDDMEDIFGKPIHVYTRAQAIADGMLIDLTPLMEQFNMKVFKWPVACTSAVWEKCINWEEGDGHAQSVPGRLWDVLTMALNAIKTKQPDASNTLHFSLNAVQRGSNQSELVNLKINAGPGDNMEPVMTIMLEGED